MPEGHTKVIIMYAVYHSEPLDFRIEEVEGCFRKYSRKEVSSFTPGSIFWVREAFSTPEGDVRLFSRVTLKRDDHYEGRDHDGHLTKEKGAYWLKDQQGLDRLLEEHGLKMVCISPSDLESRKTERLYDSFRQTLQRREG
ncbi:MAG: hypothetical protein R6U32_04955 [Candidatus Woesearchaeota archaeon]